MQSPSQLRDWTIYKITSPSGRVYIGKSSNYKQRLRQYKCIQLKEQNLITRSLVKYGVSNHTFEIIEQFSDTNDYCNSKEIFWIRSYMSNRCKFPEQNGMNMTNGGEGVLGIKRTDEYKLKCRQRRLGKTTSEYQKAVASMVHKGHKYNLGRKQSQEIINKRMANIRGSKNPESTRLKKEAANIKLRGRAIIVYDLNANVVGGYPTIKMAAKILKINRNTIANHLKGLVTITPSTKYNKYIFKYN